MSGTGERPEDLARAALDAARRRTGHNRAADATPLRLRRRRWSAAGSDPARDPQQLGATVSAWISRAGARDDVVKAEIFTRWPQLVGAAIAEHATPTALVDGQLTLQAHSTAWATQLRLMAPALTKRVNDALGSAAIRGIRAIGPTGPSWRFGARHISGRGPRDTYG